MKAVRRLFVDQSCGFDSEYACVLEFVGTRYKIVAGLYARGKRT
jgi:hypothetical protein